MYYCRKRIAAMLAAVGMLMLPACETNAKGGAGEILIGVGAGGQKPQSEQQQQSVQQQGTTSSKDDMFAGAAGSGTAENGMTPEEIAAEEEWSLILVNKTHPIPEGYEIPALTELSNGNSVDSRIYPQLQAMFDDARAQGIYPHINSSYRTMEKQQSLMDNKINEYLTAGYGQDEARALAEEWVAVPGTSEHQLGLSLDISNGEGSGQDAGTIWWWLKENCSDYGFILRYPEDKTDITGISNEPWHYRYVGVHAAKEITQRGICLEEYLGEIG